MSRGAHHMDDVATQACHPDVIPVPSSDTLRLAPFGQQHPPGILLLQPSIS